MGDSAHEQRVLGWWDRPFPAAQPAIWRLPGLRPRHVGTGLFLVLLAVFVAVRGIPLDRGMQAVWILAGMAAWQLGNPLRQWARALGDWVPFLIALLVYDFSRGIADSLGRPVLVGGLARGESELFGGTLPTVALQQAFHDPAAVHWYDVLAALVYFSHFVVPGVLAAVLYTRSRALWASFAKALLTLMGLGLATYALLPAAPPWYAAAHGVIEDPVQRIATRGWDAIGLRSAGDLIERGQADVNLVAALPSLHAGTAMLVALWAWPRLLSRLGRLLLAGYVIGMAVTLVYGGEHYALDVLMGWGYAAAAVWLAARWRPRSVHPSHSPRDNLAAALSANG